MSSVQYVKTAEDNGCVISCLAMITGQSFGDVLVGMEQYWKNEGQHEGTDDIAWFHYLSARGYAIQDVDHEYVPEDRLIKPWPIKPFAPIHMMFVYADGPHAVIMDKNGDIFDPNDPLMKSCQQYHRIYRVVGIWKVCDSLEFLAPRDDN